jgi:hypothetical protein
MLQGVSKGEAAIQHAKADYIQTQTVRRCHGEGLLLPHQPSAIPIMKMPFIPVVRAEIFALVLFFVAVGVVIAAPGDDGPVNLPAPVTLVIQDRFPGAVVMKSKKETADGQVKYVVEITFKGQKKEIEVSEEGRILKGEKE